MSYYGGDLAQYNTPFDQENVDANNPLVVNHIVQYYLPCHGKAAAATETASAVAKRIGWDETIWDLSGAMPVLK